MPIVLNQNGVYFPGWYKSADLRAQNERLREFFDLSDYVIFQSSFCREAFERWVCPVGAKPHQVLLNAPQGIEPLEYGEPKPGRFVFSLNLYTQPALNSHVVEPLVAALTASDGFAVRVFGASELLPAHLFEMIAPLREVGKIEVAPPYDSASFAKAHDGVDAFLHLSYKDACPNSVAEKICLGLPGIYSRSGGTPDLIGSAGIGLPVPDDWEQLLAVSPEDLLAAMRQMKARHSEFRALALAQAKDRLSWEAYLEAHRALFDSLAKS